MHHQGGVRTVVVGGRPELGPMQAVGGTRGAQAYTTVDLDEDIDMAEFLNDTVTGVLPNRDASNFINFAEFTIKDAVRKGEDFPLQFAYEAATCRIFYTQHTVYNYLNLWNYVVDAIWRNPSLCIDGTANATTILPTNTTGPAKNGRDITAVDSKDLANLIVSGLLSGPQIPQPSSQREKRDTPTPAMIKEKLKTHHLSNEITDGLVNSADCSSCNTRRGHICASVPSCGPDGKRTHTKSCQRACQKGSSICDPHPCYLGSGPGFCLSPRQRLALNTCATPTRNRREQFTKAVGGGDFTLPYSRNGQRLNEPP